MSSCQSFLKQITPGLRLVSPTGLVPGTNLYEFVPSGSNTVGNYPPGYMQLLPGSVQTAVTAALGVTGAVVRDMGKTIRAAVGATNAGLGQSLSYFRQYQILNPNIPLGNTSATNFGVLGDQNSPDSVSDYYTVYVPVYLAGVGLPAASNVSQVAGGSA
jgi:hypothetical protein